MTSQRERAYGNSRREAAQRIVEEMGLDPNAILIDSVTMAGYEELILDSEGRRVVLSNGHHVFHYRKWPSIVGAMKLILTLDGNVR